MSFAGCSTCEAVRFPAGEAEETNPFVRFRTMSHAHQLAIAGGLGDECFVDLVQELDAAVAAVDGQGFRTTPFLESPSLAAATGSPGRCS